MAGGWRFAYAWIVMLLLTGPVGPSPRGVNAFQPAASSGALALTAVPGVSTVFLSWSPIQDATVYEIQVWDLVHLEFKVWTSVNNTANSYLARKLMPAKQYTFRVQAFTFNGTIPIAEDTVTFMTKSCQILLPQVNHAPTGTGS
jgi:hypothetical protein